MTTTTETSPPSKEAVFKRRFAAVLQDLQQAGSKDGEAMALLGSLAGELAAKAGQKSWTGLKSIMTADAYASLLRTFDDRGNRHHREGRAKHAYAIQALAISLVAATQRSDPAMAAGEKLLDSVIDYTVAVYFRQKAAARH